MTPPDPIAALALRDCGPSGPGAPVRDHLPVHLSADARAVCLARLAHGEALYGAPLAIGWEPAPVEAIQEAADLVAYLVAAQAGEGRVRDAVELLNALMREGARRR